MFKMENAISLLLLDTKKFEAVIPRQGINARAHKLSVMKKLFPDVDFIYDPEFEKYYTMLDIFLVNELKKITKYKTTRDIAVFLLCKSESVKLALVHYINRGTEEQVTYCMRFLSLIITSENVAKEFSIIMYNNPTIIRHIDIKFDYYLPLMTRLMEINSRHPREDTSIQIMNIYGNFEFKYPHKMSLAYDTLLNSDIYRSDLIPDFLVHHSAGYRLDHDSIYRRVLTGRYENTSGYNELELLIHNYLNKGYSCDDLVTNLSPKQSPQDLIDCLQIISEVCPDTKISAEKLRELGKVSVVEFAKIKNLFTR